MKRMLKSMTTMWVILALTAAACAEQDSITIDLVVDVTGVYSVYYTAYLADDAACSGGAADLDGQALEPGRVLEYQIPAFLLGDDADLSAFSIDFSPFDQDNHQEMGRTNRVVFPAEYGGVYAIRLARDEQGFVAVPTWDEGDKFTIQIGGNVTPQDADFSYIHMDYFVGDVQCGFLYTCADQGSGVISLDFFRDAFDGLMDDVDLTAFHADVYLSYADEKGDDAVLAAMMGSPGEDVYLTSVSIPAEYGLTYRYTLTRQADGAYALAETDEN